MIGDRVLFCGGNMIISVEITGQLLPMPVDLHCRTTTRGNTEVQENIWKRDHH